MAAGVLPAPGAKYGPCKGPCGHKDCAETRRMAETMCTLCGAPIGYDRPFYNTIEHGLVHALCCEDLLEREEASNKVT
ncbi:MAG: hypothetical protein ACYC9Q_09140 [Bacillota bacterium]